MSKQEASRGKNGVSYFLCLEILFFV